MSVHERESEPRIHAAGASCHSHQEKTAGEISRRGLLGGLGGVAALGGAALVSASTAQATTTRPAPPTALAGGSPLRVKPALVYQLYERKENTSWRMYGGLHTREDVDQEAKRIEEELKSLAAKADFALEILPVSLVGSDAEAAAVKDSDGDVILVYASGGAETWLETLASSKKPNVMFLRHRSGPFYLGYETVHWRFLRKKEDTFAEPNMDVWDIVVDDYDEVLWRLRALYGLKNALGTKVAAIGGLQAYSRPGGINGPEHARNVWKYEINSIPVEEVARRLDKARADKKVLQQAERQTEALLAERGVSLQTDKQAVVNTFLALGVFKEIMSETGATNLGVANCMGGLIGILRTPPCLVLSLLNDEGMTAFCHVDMTHTVPGVLLRHISGKPSFICNTHFPHDGIITLAHCAAPRRMNGRDNEPTRIMTHFESDSGAATKVEYPKGQVITILISNVRCTKWIGLRGKIIDSPSYDICRSQMDVEIDGDWRKLLTDMQGFHAVTCYGDYLREVGYVLKKLKIEWENVSERPSCA